MVNVKKHIVFAVVLSSVSFILYFFTYGTPALNAIDQQEKAEKMLLAKSASIHLKKTVTSSRKQDLMSSVMQAAEKNGLKQVEIKSLSHSELNGTDLIAMTGVCDFYGWLGFIESVNQLSPAIFLNDVSLDVTKEADIVINASLIRYSYAQSSVAHFQKMVQKNPFTLRDKQADLVLSDITQEDDFQRISVYQLQYVGCLSQQGKRQAIVKSNAGVVRLVEVGSTIGLQSAKVIKITENAVILATKKQPFIVISL